MVRVTRSAGTVAALDPHASMSVSRVLAHARENRMNARDTRKLLALGDGSAVQSQVRGRPFAAIAHGRGAGESHIRAAVGRHGVVLAGNCAGAGMHGRRGRGV